MPFLISASMEVAGGTESFVEATSVVMLMPNTVMFYLYWTLKHAWIMYISVCMHKWIIVALHTFVIALTASSPQYKAVIRTRHMFIIIIYYNAWHCINSSNLKFCAWLMQFSAVCSVWTVYRIIVLPVDVIICRFVLSKPFTALLSYL
jgi:hypothetical protein